MPLYPAVFVFPDALDMIKTIPPNSPIIQMILYKALNGFYYSTYEIFDGVTGN